MNIITLEEIIEKKLDPFEFLENGLLEKEQKFIVEHKKFKTPKSIEKLYEFMRKNGLRYFLNSIWILQEESINYFFEENRKDLTSMKIELCIKFNQEGIMHGSKYIEDENFYKNFLYSKTFQEGVNLFNFLKDNEQALKKIRINLERLTSHPEISNVKISNYNYYLFKNFIENIENLKKNLN